jgi:hypothetical protein
VVALRSVSDRLGVKHVVDVAELAGNDGLGDTVVAVRPATDEVVGESRVPVALHIYQIVSRALGGFRGYLLSISLSSSSVSLMSKALMLEWRC